MSRIKRRRRRVTLVIFTSVLAVLVGAAAFLGGRWYADRDLVQVAVAADGRDTVVTVRGLPDVAEVLSRAGVQPRNGRLLSAKERKVLEPDHDPYRLTVAGRPVQLTSPLASRQTVRLVDGTDTTEPTVESTQAIAPHLPDYSRFIDLPGAPGTARVVTGAISGEVVDLQIITPPGDPVRTTRKVVALTFDDGPNPASTPAVLDILNSKGVKATFCIIGKNASAHPDLVRRIAAEGHGLCNHSLSHDEHLGSRNDATIEKEVGGGAQAITDAGVAAPTYYRPPGGNLSTRVFDVARAHGEQPLYWSVDTDDWRKPPPEAIVQRAVSGARPGAIILMHDGGGDRTNTILALGALIDQLRAAGYTFVLPTTLPTASPGAGASA